MYCDVDSDSRPRNQAGAREVSIQLRSPQSMTLREKLIEAERLTRELIHHLEHGFVPKAHVLRRTARQGNEASHDDITDITVRSTVDRVFEADDFSRQLSDQLQMFLNSIDMDVRKLTGR